MSKTFLGFVGVALVAGVIGYVGGNGAAVGLARVVFFLSALGGLAAFLLDRDARA